MFTSARLIQSRTGTPCELVARQFEWLKGKTAFYSKFYGKIAGLLSENGVWPEALPATYSELLCAQDPMSLVASENCQQDPILAHRCTGGTGRNPLSLLYSSKDWSRLVALHGLLFGRLFDGQLARTIAFNTYNQNHVAGPMFSEGLTAAGAVVFNSCFLREPHDVLKAIIRIGANIVVAPPVSTVKGGSLRDLLKADAEGNYGCFTSGRITGIAVSSTELSQTLIDELHDLGVTNILNLYGSSEVFPLAVGCPHNPLLFHAITDINVIEVVDSNRRPVPSGTRGRIIGGRVGFMVGNTYHPSRSTGILNHLNGDEGTAVREPCTCGFDGLSIREIQRVSLIDEKAKHGCQEW